MSSGNSPVHELCYTIAVASDRIKRLRPNAICMFCTGNSYINTSRFESEAAQLHVVLMFTKYFMIKHPTGIVISELEYMGRTTMPSKVPGPLQISGRANVNRILRALSEDYRRWKKDLDFRKSDVMGISDDGFNAELLEVTTWRNERSAVTQINSKLAILNQTVNRIHHLNVDWRASNWKPEPSQMFKLLNNYGLGIRYICYMPTIRKPVPKGVILYEIHDVPRQPVPIPVPAPSFAGEKMKKAIPQDESMLERARKFLRDHPDIAVWIRRLALGLAVGAVIAAIVLTINPFPGDELVAYKFAEALFIIATRQVYLLRS